LPQICSVCGLPKDICACTTIAKETTQKLRVYREEKKFKKPVTVVEGLSGEDLERTAKELKHKLACGGSYKDGRVVLQGDHKEKVRQYLVQLGYPPEAILVV
jgi:translation initiation factor 1